MSISFYLTNRFEFLIDKLQSKKKTIEISKLKPKYQIKINDEKLLVEQDNCSDNNNNNNNKENQFDHTSAYSDNETIPKRAPDSINHSAYKQILDIDNNNDDNNNNNNNINNDDDDDVDIGVADIQDDTFQGGKLKKAFRRQIKTSALVTCPSLIYIILVLLISLTNSLQVPASESSESKPVSAASNIPVEQPRQKQQPDTSSLLDNSKLLPSLALNFKVLSDGFLRQLSNRDRWIQVPEPSNPFSRPTKRPTRTSNNDNNNINNRRPSPISRAIERIGRRIGSRNSIRVHNAFRDFAWRIMSTLSMPTPVIYELRRQNFYSPEDDLRNDYLYNKNTTKTIRSRSLLSKEYEAINQLTNLRAQHRSNDDDDAEDDRNLESRLRSRLEHLINLSRRSLFGRVIRMPSLFPFKRQEENSNTGEKAPSTPTVNSTSTSKKDSSNPSKTSTTRRPSAWRRMRRKRKDHDRQMISINGKQYYVNDEGELKDWNDQSDT